GKKDFESLRKLKNEKEKLIESIETVLDEREKKREELKEKFNLKKE
ncbi:MAG: hypothetical protein GTN39_05460, partial [Candidatus Aenigmarchaeota archaeon]|nr:hypothetical protein [Candidatus Aenigmarchaeota archaeon]